MKLEWMNPPAAHNGRRSKVDQMVATLRKNPGAWARVDKGMRSTAATVKWKKVGCEAVARTSTDDSKLWDVFARWPETPPEAAPEADTLYPPMPVVPRATKVAAEQAKPPSEPGEKHATATTTGLDPDDPQDQYLARQRAKLETDRAARLAKAGRKADYAKAR